jgi:hypothetical protein
MKPNTEEVSQPPAVGNTGVPPPRDSAIVGCLSAVRCASSRHNPAGLDERRGVVPADAHVTRTACGCQRAVLDQSANRFWAEAGKNSCPFDVEPLGTDNSWQPAPTRQGLQPSRPLVRQPPAAVGDARSGPTGRVARPPQRASRAHGRGRID